VGERVPRAILWQAALLLPHPILTVLYLLAVRAQRVEPRFGPVVALLVLPVVAGVLGVSHLRRATSAEQRGGQLVLLALAALEAAFTGLAAAVVGFAIGLRSL